MTKTEICRESCRIEECFPDETGAAGESFRVDEGKLSGLIKLLSGKTGENLGVAKSSHCCPPACTKEERKREREKKDLG